MSSPSAEWSFRRAEASTGTGPTAWPLVYDRGMTRIVTPSFWPLQLLGWSGYALISFLSALAHGKELRYLIVVLTVATAGLLMTTALHFVLKRIWQWPVGKLIAVLAPCFIGIAVSLGLVSAFAIEAYCPETCKPANFLGYLAYSASAAYIALSWIALWFGIRLQRAYSAERKRTLLARAQAQEAQLKMLRYQLNPHFLFNTLNAISTLVLDNRNAVAERMLAALSRFLRYTLDQDPQQQVTLKRELEILQLYLGIEQMRFAERLRLDFQIDPQVENVLLPSLILQPIVENSIKYAVAKCEQGCTLALRANKVSESGAEYLQIEFTDDGPGCPGLDLHKDHGVGLRNTRERLQTHYGAQQRFVVANRPEGGVRVLLTIPLQGFGNPAPRKDAPERSFEPHDLELAHVRAANAPA